MRSKILGVLSALCLLFCVCSVTAAAQDVCRTREDVIRVLKNAARSRPETIHFQFDASLYRKIEDASWMGGVLPYADILTAGWRYSSRECTLHQITYAQMEQCESGEDVKWILQHVQRSPLYLHLAPSLYRTLAADDFAGLREIHGQIGLQSGFSYYGEPQCVLKYEDIQFLQNRQHVESWEQLKQGLWQKTESLESQFAFHMPRALFDLVMAEDARLLKELEANCGLFDRELFYTADTGTVEWKNVQYYPGKRVVAAARGGMWQLLTREEQQLYNKAAEIIRSCYTPDTDAYTFQLRCHDAIIRQTGYALNSYMGDTAVGALLYGRADCDGYADALYLLCNLAGVECHYQHGEGGNSPSQRGRHMWNLIRMGDAWYFTDVTWDDGEECIFYGHMNLGEDRARQDYLWEEEAMLQPVAKTTSSSFYYYEREGTAFRSVSRAREYMDARGMAGDREVHLMLSQNGSKSASALVDQLMKDARVGGRYLTKSLGRDLIVCFLPQ